MYRAVEEALALKPDVHSVPTSSASDCAQSFVSGLFLISAIQALLEKHWLIEQQGRFSKATFGRFLNLAFDRELEPLGFLRTLLKNSNVMELKTVSLCTTTFTRRMIKKVLAAQSEFYREFTIEAAQRMGDLIKFESTSQSKRSPDFLPSVLYRSFDLMDEILALDYENELGLKNNSEERIYEGAGVGVQTSYATILDILEHLQLPANSHVIDLGSGYGRLGLIGGLWRSDLQFTGYEFVAHRVDVSQKSAARTGLTARVRFHEQDLGDPSFQIPAADVYYMYDPFNEQTYGQVLDRLLNVAREQPITIVSKAIGTSRFRDFAVDNGWDAPEFHDGGNIQILKTKAP